MVNGASFAVPMATVRQVLRQPIVTRIPLSPTGLMGVLNIRGEIVALLDAGILTATGALGEPPFAVLLSSEKEMLALAAEELPVSAALDTPVVPATNPGKLCV